MSAAAAKAQRLRTVEATVDDLLRAPSDYDFTRARLLRAVQALREIAPSIEVSLLLRLGDSSNFEFECSVDDAIKLVGRNRLPKPPRRVRRFWHCSDWLEYVRRVRYGRVRISCLIRATTPPPLSAFTPSAIHALAADDTGLVPDRPQAWKEAVIKEAQQMMQVAEPSMIEGILRSPLLLDRLRRRPEGEDKATARAAIDAVNLRFHLREADLRHIVALYSRLYGELWHALADAIGRAPVEERGHERPWLRLAVDNTQQVRS